MSDMPTQAYLVVANHEDQFALWRADLPVPAGWDTRWGPGDHAACLAEIERVWTDMTPRSVRNALSSASKT